MYTALESSQAIADVVSTGKHS